MTTIENDQLPPVEDDRPEALEDGQLDGVEPRNTETKNAEAKSAARNGASDEPETDEAGVELEPDPVNGQLAGEQLQRIVEGALLAAGKPLAVEDLAALFDESERPAAEAIRIALRAIAEQSAGRGFELREIASGFRFQVVQEVAPWIARLWEEKPQKYSRALLETLALIAYRQPITRGDIEDIRGVAVATNIIKTLLEREWVRVVGHKDVPGRPAMYATTRRFLDYFNLKNLDELPALSDLRDLDALSAQLSIEGADTLLPDPHAESEAEQQELISDDGEPDSAMPITEQSNAEQSAAEQPDIIDDAATQLSPTENEDGASGTNVDSDIESNIGAVDAAGATVVDDEPRSSVDDEADEMASVAQSPSIGSVS